jgi:hypothetical protein
MTCAAVGAADDRKQFHNDILDEEKAFIYR